MNNEEKFKKSIKDLLDERQFSYDADNWDQASLQMDKKEKRNRLFLFFLFCFIGLGIGVIRYLFLDKNIDKAQFEQTVSKKSSGSSDVENPETARKEKIGEHSIESGSFELNSEEKTTLKNNRWNSVKDDDKIKNQSLSKSLPANTNFEGGNKALSFRKRPKLEKSTAKNSLQLANESVAIKNDHDTLNSKTEIFENSSNSGRVDTSRSMDRISAAVYQKDSANALPGTEVNENEKDEILMNGLQAIKNDSNGTKKIIVSIAKDSVIAAPQPTINYVQKTNFIFAELGGIFNLGWKYQGSREASGITPYFAVGYSTQVSSRLAISIGIGYSELRNLKYNVKVIKSTKVLFGEESDVTAITPVKLNYVNIPAKMEYIIDDKQNITIGYNWAYLLDVKSQVETFTERAGVKEDKTSSKLAGYREGFSKYNSQIAIGYRRKMYRNFWLNGEVFFGLSDIRDDAFFGLDLYERLTGMKFGITYKLFN
jgi:hypothetical protein